MHNINALRDAIRLFVRSTASYAARNATPYRSAVLIYLALVLQSHLSLRAPSNCPSIDKELRLASPETRMYAAAASAVGRARSRSRSGSVSASGYVL